MTDHTEPTTPEDPPHSDEGREVAAAGELAAGVDLLVELGQRIDTARGLLLRAEFGAEYERSTYTAAADTQLRWAQAFLRAATR